MGWGGVGFSKYSMLVVLALALVACLWAYGRSVFTGFAKWLLWALAAYAVKVAESSRKRGKAGSVPA